jgi:glycosyltransferase involved in cell wall biosynthesis
VSTYPPIECGIATYTRFLTDALRAKEVDVYIISHYGGQGKNVFSTFDYEDKDLSYKIFDMVIRLSPDLVHIQHEFNLFGKHYGVAIVPLYLQLKMTKIPCVTTLHSVYKKNTDEHKILFSSFLNYSDKVIVHESFQKEALIKELDIKGGSNNKICVIPHGAREILPIPHAKKKLGLDENTKIVLMIGYFSPYKNFEKIIDIWPEIVKRYGEKVILLIAGKLRTISYLDYRNLLFERINSSPARTYIKVIRGQISQESFDIILSAADVVVLPYKKISQSGIFAHCMAFGKPVVTSNNPTMRTIFSEYRAGLMSDTDEEYIENILCLLKDEKKYMELSQNACRYVKEKISWSIVAKKHIEIYRELIEPSVLNVSTIWMD